MDRWPRGHKMCVVLSGVHTTVARREEVRCRDLCLQASPGDLDTLSPWAAWDGEGWKGSSGEGGSWAVWKTSLHLWVLAREKARAGGAEAGSYWSWKDEGLEEIRFRW